MWAVRAPGGAVSRPGGCNPLEDSKPSKQPWRGWKKGSGRNAMGRMGVSCRQGGEQPEPFRITNRPASETMGSNRASTIHQRSKLAGSMRRDHGRRPNGGFVCSRLPHDMRPRANCPIEQLANGRENPSLAVVLCPSEIAPSLPALWDMAPDTRDTLGLTSIDATSAGLCFSPGSACRLRQPMPRPGRRHLVPSTSRHTMASVLVWRLGPGRWRNGAESAVAPSSHGRRLGTNGCCDGRTVPHHPPPTR